MELELKLGTVCTYDCIGTLQDNFDLLTLSFTLHKNSIELWDGIQVDMEDGWQDDPKEDDG
jgi:hypothetical protein